MRRFSRRYFWLIAAGLAVLGYELVPRDERRISGLLADICSQLNLTRDAGSLSELQAMLRAKLEPRASLESVELGQEVSGAESIAARASELLTSAPLSFALTDVEVRVSGALARVTANLLVTVRGSGEQHRDLRFTRINLRKSAGAWRVEAIVVEPVRNAEPEARP